MGGIRSINKTLAIFTKIEKELNKGVLECFNETKVRVEEIEMKKIEINTIESKIKEIDSTRRRAEKVIDKLKEILG